MYATCLFCNNALGRNESIESIPIGRRLAFDSARGHLWVVCTHCERWNLSPLETRWEAIEEAERAFRTTPLRASTDNIGFARLREGLELVRVGAPLRTEFAAWRYGDQFGRRRRRHVIGTAALTSAVAAPMVASIAGAMGMGLLFGGLGALALVTVSLSGSGYIAINSLYRRREIGRMSVMIPDGNGNLLLLTNRNVGSIAFEPARGDDGWCLEVPHRIKRAVGKGGEGASKVAVVTTHTRLTGEVARHALSKVLPRLNRDGGKVRRVRDAVGVIESAATLDGLMKTAAGYADHRRGFSAWMNTPRDTDETRVGNVGQMPGALRLALEIALHEDDEHRAMHGELLQLEARWREAEEIATIADGLLVPAQVEEGLAELKRKDR